MTTPRFAAPLNSEATPALQWIEVASSFQIPSFHIIGLPGPEVSEARERVRAAIEASGFEFPRRRVVINLSPASIRKHGTGSDLAIALAILVSSGEIKLPVGSPCGPTIAAWGELGLGGEIRPARRIVRAVHACWSQGISALVVARAEYSEAQAGLRLLRESGTMTGPEPLIIPAKRLREACQFLASPPQSTSESHGSLNTSPSEFPVPHSQAPLLPLPSVLERIVTAAVIGAHHLLLLGPRGTGKSHALEWSIALQPAASPLAQTRSRLLTELKSQSADPSIDPGRGPIRRVSTQVRPAALIGSATPSAFTPGEFTLSDGGILIADELPEWSRDSREALREPLERRRVTLTRTLGSIELPASFTLFATGNLCPCGGWPNEIPRPPSEGAGVLPSCRCAPSHRERYLNRLSGPLLDRMDLVHLVINPVHSSYPTRQSKTHSRLNQLRDLIVACQSRLRKKWGDLPGYLSPDKLQEIVEQRPELQESLLRYERMSLRARHKTLRVALTLAMLDGDIEPDSSHLTEASLLRIELQTQS